MKLLISLIVVTSFLLSGCNIATMKGSENLIQREFDFNNFQNIEVDDSFTVKIVNSEEYKIELECNENVEEYVSIVKDGNVLQFSLKKTSISNLVCEVTVYMPNLTSLETNGATKVNFLDYTSKELQLDLSGASRVLGHIKIDDLKIETSGASKMNLTGDVINGTISSSGASMMNLDDLIFENLVIDCSGASKVVANVTNELNVELSRASKFDYYGTAKIISQEISGVGRINNLD